RKAQEPPMNILHYTMTLDPMQGGVVAHVSDLARLVSDAGHEVTVAVPQHEPRPENLRGPDAPRVIGLGPLVARGKILSRSQLARFMHLAAEADAVHLHETWDPGAIQIARRLRRAGIPYAATPHGMLDDWCMSYHPIRKHVFLRLFARRFFAGAAATLFCAQGELDQASAHIDISKCHVVPAATDLTDFQQLPGPDIARDTIPGCEGDAPVVLFLSRIDHKKGLEVLVDAMPAIRDRHADARLVIAGAGEPSYVSSIEQRIADRGIGACTHLVGMIRGKAKVSLYQRAATLALPTQQENFGLVLTECMAAETPVITTKAVDIWPEIQACNGGDLVDRTPDAFATAVGDLIDAPDRAVQMGRSGREWVMRTLSSESLTRQFLSIYESVVRNARDTGR
ncbi:MAG: glycosyltransferase, partial [Planctomycetota bacterium]